MQPVLTVDDIRKLDAECIRQGIPASTLMETAAANVIKQSRLLDHATRVVVACGNGNNGGDGYAIARMLSDSKDVVIVGIPQRDAMSPETAANYDAVVQMGLPITSPEHLPSIDADVIVDALVGVGGSAELREPVASWAEIINAHDALVVAVDVPTGLDAASGACHPHAIRATETITMEAWKPGMLGANGRRLCGHVGIASIGAPDGMTMTWASEYVLESDDIRWMLPERALNSHKYTYGHVVVVAGSSSMRGAACLASEAALRAGAGLVTLVTDAVHPLLPREVMTAGFDQLHTLARRASVVLLGPGFGTEPSRIAILRELLEAFPSTPAVVDADGLRALESLSRSLHNVIVTPHPGEFARLLELRGLDVMPADVPSSAVTAAQMLSCIVHLKCIPPTTTNGMRTYYSTSGNPALAKAGSGDVLSGIIAAFVAQRLPLLDAAALGAFVHGLAADRLARSKAKESITAGDIIRELGSTLDS